jgi:hypothetical protein
MSFDVFLSFLLQPPHSLQFLGKDLSLLNTEELTRLFSEYPQLADVLFKVATVKKPEEKSAL